jgi:hypothetical protein
VVNGVVQNDARGAIIQLINTITNEWIATNNDMQYTGNIVADAQIMVAKAIHNKVLQDTPLLQTQGNSIAVEMIEWAEDPTRVFDPDFRCNGDSMHHVVKGSIMIRVENTRGFTIKGNTISNASVLSGPASSTQEYFNLFSNDNSWSCSTYHRGASVEDPNEQ